MPASLAEREVDVLPCVRGTVGFARKGRSNQSDEWRGIALVGKGQLRDVEAWLARPDQFCARLQLLAANGIPQVFALELVRTWGQGQHPACNAPTRSRPAGRNRSTPAP